MIIVFFRATILFYPAGLHSVKVVTELNSVLMFIDAMIILHIGLMMDYKLGYTYKTSIKH